MSKKRSLLERMKENPRSDWRIKDVQKLCDELGLELIAPTSGSHYKVVSSNLRDILTVPAHRPIKAPYIRNIVSYAEAHCELGEEHE